MTQKSVDECRLLVRELTPNKGAVLSLCNGTGSVQVAAALEGRSSLGVDSSERQVRWAKKRLETLLIREDYLLQALAAGRGKENPAVQTLEAAVKRPAVLDPEVSLVPLRR